MGADGQRGPCLQSPLKRLPIKAPPDRLSVYRCVRPSPTISFCWQGRYKMHFETTAARRIPVGSEPFAGRRRVELTKAPPGQATDKGERRCAFRRVQFCELRCMGSMLQYLFFMNQRSKKDTYADTYTYTWLSFCLSIRPPVHPSVCPSCTVVLLPVLLPIHPVHPSFCLVLSLSVSYSCPIHLSVYTCL